MPDKLKLGLAILVMIVGIGVFYYFSGFSIFIRVAIILISGGVSVFILLKTAIGRESRDFILESRGEVRKVVWPTRAETFQSTLVVMGMVVVMAVLMWFLDAVLLWLVRLLTGTES
ncbi:Protein translocase subunit SecE [Gammaproteobacteria bacterium]